MVVYRLARQAFAEDLSGEGARLFGGRWNHAGTPCIYSSLSRALCILELIVNLELGALPPSLRMVAIELPVENIETWVPDTLPPGWAGVPLSAASQQHGTAWLEAAAALAVRVPSVIVPEEWNVLINPLHPDARRLRILENKPFPLDARLLL